MDLLVKLMRLSPPPYFLVERQKKTLPQWVNIIVVRLALAHVDPGASGKATQTHLGWLPEGPGLPEDLSNMNKG